MVSLKGFALFLFVALSPAVATAQEAVLSVTGGILEPGQTITIGYTACCEDGLYAVQISDGGEEESTVLIDVVDGWGEGIWEVPEGWDVAVFNAPYAENITRFIEEELH